MMSGGGRALPRDRVAVITGQRVTIGLMLLTLSALIGCGGGSTYGLSEKTSPPALATSQITVGFNPAPPSSLATGQQSDVTATVTKDPNDYGVDWLVTCGDQDCGSLTLGITTAQAVHTASGQPVLYAAPLSLSGNQLTVNIIAFASADHTKNALATVTITP